MINERKTYCKKFTFSFTRGRIPFIILFGQWLPHHSTSITIELLGVIWTSPNPHVISDVHHSSCYGRFKPKPYQNLITK